MLNRTVVLLGILIAVSSWQEASAKIMQVDFTAELIGADPELAGIDTAIEGAYRFDDGVLVRETNIIGEFVYTELLGFQIKLSDQVYGFNEGLIYYSQATEIISGVNQSLNARDPFDLLYGVAIGEVVYPENQEPVEINDPPLTPDDLDNLGGLHGSIFIDLDGDGVNDANEVIATFTDFGDLYVFDVSFKTIPDVLSPSIVIDFTSVFSVIDSEESLAPVPVSEEGAATLTINYAIPMAVGGEESPHEYSAEYQITSLVTTVLVPEPTSFATLILVLALLSRRRSGL